MAKTEKSTAVAVQNSGVAAFDASTLQVKTRLILPTISIKAMKEGDHITFKAQGEIIYKEQVDEDTGEIKLETKGPRKGQPALLPILAASLPNGSMGQIVLPAIAHGAFKTAAEAGPLVGRIFAMRKGKSKGTGKANEWEVVELG